jgi:hypothetical protein
MDGLAATWPNVTCVHCEKAGDWLRQIAEVASVHATGDAVLGLGDDDYLLDGLIRELGWVDAPIVWADHYFINTLGQAVATSVSGYVQPTTLSAGQVRERFLHPQNDPSRDVWRPAGVGCAVRRDLWLDMWLKHGASEMGPISDAIAFSAAACLHGAHFVPKKLAAFTQRSDSYSGSAHRDPQKRGRMFEASRTFLGAFPLSKPVAAAILAKWFPDQVHE